MIASVEESGYQATRCLVIVGGLHQESHQAVENQLLVKVVCLCPGLTFNEQVRLMLLPEPWVTIYGVYSIGALKPRHGWRQVFPRHMMIYIGQRGCGYRDARKVADFWKVRTAVPKAHGPV